MASLCRCLSVRPSALSLPHRTWPSPAVHRPSAAAAAADAEAKKPTGPHCTHTATSTSDLRVREVSERREGPRRQRYRGREKKAPPSPPMTPTPLARANEADHQRRQAGRPVPAPSEGERSCVRAPRPFSSFAHTRTLLSALFRPVLSCPVLSCPIIGTYSCPILSVLPHRPHCGCGFIAVIDCHVYIVIWVVVIIYRQKDS
ncbi:hypothetical protein IWX47DRAFT_360702 [Phyllosticta citricarpa]